MFSGASPSGAPPAAAPLIDLTCEAAGDPPPQAVPVRRPSEVLLAAGPPTMIRDALQLRALPQMFGWPQGLAIRARHAQTQSLMLYGNAMASRQGAPEPLQLIQRGDGVWQAGQRNRTDTRWSSPESGDEPLLRAVMLALGFINLQLGTLMSMMTGDARCAGTLPWSTALQLLNLQIAAAYDEGVILDDWTTCRLPARPPAALCGPVARPAKRPCEDASPDGDAVSERRVRS